MLYALFFFLGFTSAIVFTPILSKIEEIILLWFEAKKINSAKRIIDYEKEVVMLKDFINSPVNQLNNDNCGGIYYTSDDDIEDY